MKHCHTLSLHDWLFQLPINTYIPQKWHNATVKIAKVKFPWPESVCLITPISGVVFLVVNVSPRWYSKFKSGTGTKLKFSVKMFVFLIFFFAGYLHLLNIYHNSCVIAYDKHDKLDIYIHLNLYWMQRMYSVKAATIITYIDNAKVNCLVSTLKRALQDLSTRSTQFLKISNFNMIVHHISVVIPGVLAD